MIEDKNKIILEAMLQKAIAEKKTVDIRINDNNGADLDCMTHVILSNVTFNNETDRSHVLIQAENGFSLSFIYERVIRNDNAACKFYIETDTIIITIIIK